jgi:hypothetical protein
MLSVHAIVTSKYLPCLLTRRTPYTVLNGDDDAPTPDPVFVRKANNGPSVREGRVIFAFQLARLASTAPLLALSALTMFYKDNAPPVSGPSFLLLLSTVSHI